MANPKRIDFTDDEWSRSGIAVEYVKRRNVISVYGWYDTMVGIQGGSMPLGEFLDRLGIGETDVRRALKDRAGG